MSLNPFNHAEVRTFVMERILKNLTLSKDPDWGKVYTALLGDAELRLIASSAGSLDGPIKSEESIVHTVEVDVDHRWIRFNVVEFDRD